jgi:hypothetical protein
VEDGPLPETGSQIILLVGIRNKGVVGCHHSNVEVDKVLEERRLVVTRVARWKSLIGMALDIPMSVDIARAVLLDASSLNLLETPLR